MIVSASILAVWDGGKVQLTSPCKVNTVTREVFDVEEPLHADDVDVFQGYYLILNGEEYPIYVGSSAVAVNQSALYLSEPVYWLA